MGRRFAGLLLVLAPALAAQEGQAPGTTAPTVLRLDSGLRAPGASTGEAPAPAIPSAESDAPAPLPADSLAPPAPVPAGPTPAPQPEPAPAPLPAPAPQQDPPAPAPGPMPEPAPAPAPGADVAPAPVTPLPSPAPTPDVAPPLPVPAYEAVVNDFHQAMAEGWKEGVLRHLADGVRIYEQGYAERSRDEYAAGHLDSDLVFAAATRRERLGRESGSSGDHAWVLSQSRTQGEIGGRTVDLEQTETMLLQRVGEAWQIVHIHWSAHGRGD